MFLIQIYYKPLRKIKTMNSQKSPQLSLSQYSSRNLSHFKSIWHQKNQSRCNLYDSIKSKNPNNTFLLRIPYDSWQYHDSIYQWRLTQPQNVVSLLFYKQMQNINNVNNRRLVKVSIEEYVCKFSELTEINFIKCLQLMKNVINGSIICMKKLGLKIIKSNHIVIAENGEAKIWPSQNFQINPQNSIQTTEIKFCQQFIKIFKEICLQTKLSHEFFMKGQDIKNLTNMKNFIQDYEFQHNLHTLSFSKPVSSTTLGTLSRQLKFSDKKSIRKQKNKISKVQSLPYFSHRTELCTFLNHKQTRKSQFLNQDQVKSQYFCANNDNKCSNISPKYSSTTYLTRAHNGSGFLSPSPQRVKKTQSYINKTKNHSSFVISEIYQDDLDQRNQDDQQMKKQKKMHSQIQQKQQQITETQCFGSTNTFREGWSSCLAFPKIQKNREYNDNPQLGSKLTLNQIQQIQHEALKSQTLSEEEQVDPLGIIAKNGWSTNFIKILNTPNMKQSVTIGRQENALIKQIHLQKLTRLGKDILQSFIPMQQ